MTSELATAAAVPAATSVSLGAALAMSAPTVLVAQVDVAERAADGQGSEPPDPGSATAQGPTAATASAEISARRAAGTTQKTVTVAVTLEAASAEDPAPDAPIGDARTSQPPPTALTSAADPIAALRTAVDATPSAGPVAPQQVRTTGNPEASIPRAYPGPDRGWSASGTRLGTAGSDGVEYRPIPETPAMRGPAAGLATRDARPPVPVIVASGLVGLMTAGFVALAMFMATLGPAILLAPLCGATLTAFLAVGLWRGARGANLVTLLLATLALYTGVANLITGTGGGAITALPRIVIGGALFGLLLGHRETRQHFWS